MVFKDLFSPSIVYSTSLHEKLQHGNRLLRAVSVDLWHVEVVNINYHFLPHWWSIGVLHVKQTSRHSNCALRSLSAHSKPVMFMCRF